MIPGSFAQTPLSRHLSPHPVLVHSPYPFDLYFAKTRPRQNQTPQKNKNKNPNSTHISPPPPSPSPPPPANPVSVAGIRLSSCLGFESSAIGGEVEEERVELWCGGGVSHGMADLLSYGNAERHFEQVLIGLKKGTQLLKYGRKGKPKYCPFKLSNDETTLIWITSGSEKNLKLSSVSGIVPGQRTAVFRRYLRPEKDYLSFSLIYDNGKRSLDLDETTLIWITSGSEKNLKLSSVSGIVPIVPGQRTICKDNVEAEVWIAGLRALISLGKGGRSKIDGWNDGGVCFNESRGLISDSPSDSSASLTRRQSSPEISLSFTAGTFPKYNLFDNFLSSDKSHVTLDDTKMQVKGSGSDVFRVSVSSAPSTSSHGSAADESDVLSDVYIWGEVVCDNVTKAGGDNNGNTITARADVILPRPLESNLGWDVHHIACGVKHAAVVTRHGEVFTWGDQSGGRLGHGVGNDVSEPRLVESLAAYNVDFVACGEFHTCAVTMAGELYSWGDGIHNVGLLGNGTDVSHWIPKRILGPLEGLQVASVSCGPWHTALITSNGQLFTFGDGTFGVLGHGDRGSVSYPREVESLSGLRTIAVACGVWHTAAVVEVIMTQSSSAGSSGKLFTWGDGDKNRLGQGDSEPRLNPTCVPALIEHNFLKVACGHTLTLGLTTSRQVFSMGSTVYGQLGNPDSDGKLPCLVEDKIFGESVEEIACGAYHVAVLTSRNEVYTWGKGANGRLGHGDIEDKKTPTLVDALRDRHVKYITCGSTYTAAICLHKWISGGDQPQCSACRQAFGFTRKKHKCYNCGSVLCHACSSRKSLRAALAPNPDKPYRVCDSCFAKLSKMSETGSNRRKSSGPRLSSDNKDKLDKPELRLTKSVFTSNLDLIKQLDTKAAKQARKAEAFSLVSSTQASPFLHLKDVLFSGTIDPRRTIPRPALTSSEVNSRAVSPFSRKASPPRSATPVPTTSGLSLSRSSADSLKKTNELLNQEVVKLRAQVESLARRCELKESELQQSKKKAEEAMGLAAEESAKTKAAKEVIKSLTAQLFGSFVAMQLFEGLSSSGYFGHRLIYVLASAYSISRRFALKDMAERLPPGSYDSEEFRLANLPNGLEPNGAHSIDACGEHQQPYGINGLFSASAGVESTNGSKTALPPNPIDPNASGGHGPLQPPNGSHVAHKDNLIQQKRSSVSSNGGGDRSSPKRPSASAAIQASEAYEDRRDSGLSEDGDSSRRLKTLPSSNSQVEAEWIEQYEPGVYITLLTLKDGTRDLKRVRFSRRRFGEHQAEAWWSENRDKLYEKLRISDKASVSGQTARRSDGAISPSSQHQ
ncbi:PH, RCC1 and FYVE domains-containing protein [Drosera capensis]